MAKNFQKLDEEFTCEVCHRRVDILGYTTRDHCPYCLYSKHLDIYPGDRNNSCRGILKPIAVEKYKNTYKIIYQCQKCQKIHKNIVAQDDNLDKIIEIMTNPIIY